MLSLRDSDEITSECFTKLLCRDLSKMNCFSKNLKANHCDYIYPICFNPSSTDLPIADTSVMTVTPNDARAFDLASTVSSAD